MDIAAIYGACNNKIVMNMIEDLFELEPRFASDFKHCFDLLISQFKNIFFNAEKVDKMIRGDTVQQKSKSEQQKIILLFL